MDLNGRTAIVTGGAGSLGRTIVAALRRNGANVAVFDSAKAPSSSDDAGVHYIEADVSDEIAVAAGLRTAIAVFGKISVLVNAAGAIHSEPLVNLLSKQRRHGLESWERALRANLTTTFLVSAHVAEHMVASRTKGVIVNFSSVAAAGNPGQSAYAAAKAGVEALTSVWAKELGPLGIRTVAIAPGFADTPSTHDALPEATVKEWVRRTPLRRLATADEIAGAVFFAISNDFLTGRTLAVDGGADHMNADIPARVVIFGAGKVAEVIFRHMRLAGRDIVAFTVDAAFVPESETFLGLPVVPFEDVTSHYSPQTHAMIVAIGYHDLNRVRRARYADARAKGYRLASLIALGARCGDWVEMGDNCIVLDGAVIEPGVRLGSNVVIWSGALIGHHSTIGDHCWIAGHAVFGGSAMLGAGSFAALGAIVGNEVEIGDESFLGAGVLVTKCADARSVFVAQSTEKFRLDSDRFLKISKIR